MTLHLRGKIWYYDFRIGGRRYAGSTGMTNRTNARNAENKLKVQYRSEYSPQQIWEQTRHALCQSARVPLDLETIWKLFIDRSLSRACDKKMQSYRAYIREFLT